MSLLEERYLSNIISKMAFGFGKMAFVAGPRQVGKTTLAKDLLAKRGAGKYGTWDDKDFRKLWHKGPASLRTFLQSNGGTTTKKPIAILDEIHKDRRWKGNLKGFYDLYGTSFDVIVTGSARLNIYRRGGDSLLGRYFPFRLHPLSQAEILGKRADEPTSFIESIMSPSPPALQAGSVTKFERLLKFGGFPDPYLNQNDQFSALWRSGRLEKIIHEDLRDLSRLPELSQVEALALLMPDRIGSPLSVQSLREELEVAYDTVKRWLNYLENLYFHFTIRPFTTRVARSLKKEPKIYLYDWSEVEDHGARFENLVASHLLKACDYWSDCGRGQWDLRYLRDKDKFEVDFLLTNKNKPVVSFECKYSDDRFDPSVLKFAGQIGITNHIQIVAKPGIWQRREIDGLNILIASADAVLSLLV
ncbi:MAG: ATP-binding protein [Deltaproteobacteria bacterium]|nr:ATP-binding protein [Deltaproteobacteria bacterium]